jgi:hypothetical protein
LLLPRRAPAGAGAASFAGAAGGVGAVAASAGAATGWVVISTMGFVLRSSVAIQDAAGESMEEEGSRTTNSVHVSSDRPSAIVPPWA